MAKIVFYTQSYNAEQYIAQAIESVLEQTETDLIYYIADDCSTDTTPDIIRKYAAQDSRIRPVFMDRNDFTGTRVASLSKIYEECGDVPWYAELDADDWYEKTFAADMIRRMEEGADLAIASTVFEFVGDATSSGTKRWDRDAAMFSKEQLAGEFMRLLQLMRVIWGKVYRLDLMRDNRLLPREVVYGADTMFVAEYMKHIERLYVTPDIYHSYRIYPESVSNRYKPNRLEADMMLSHALKEFLIHIDGYNLENAYFLELVNAGSFVITFEMLIKCVNQGITVEEDPDELARHPFYQNAWQVIGRNNNRSYLNGQRKICWNRIPKYRTGASDPFCFAMMQVICPGVEEFWDSGDVKAFVSSSDLKVVQAFLYGEREDILKDAPPIRNRAKNALPDLLRAWVHMREKQNYLPMAQACSVYGKVLTQRQKAWILEHHPLLRNVTRGMHLFGYPELVAQVLENDLEGTLNAIPELLNRDFEGARAAAVIELGQVLAACLNLEELYVTYLKVELEWLLGKGEEEDFLAKWRELDALLPGDPELAALHEAFLRSETGGKI